MNIYKYILVSNKSKWILKTVFLSFIFAISLIFGGLTTSQVAQDGMREGMNSNPAIQQMSKEQLMQRLLCSEAEIDSQRVRSGHMQANDWEKITNVMNYFTDVPLYIDDTPGATIVDIRAKCRRLVNENKKLGLVIIDYLQLMEGSKSQDDRFQQISSISRGLKSLARELNVPVIALSQLSRAVEQRTEKKPMLSDLRESGAIEQDADIVIFIHRDEYYEPENIENKGKATIMVAKHRNGATKNFELLFQSNITKFKNKTKKPEI